MVISRRRLPYAWPMVVPRAASRGRHALAIVEAAYSLDGPDSEWLARVLDAASPDLDRGLGSYAFTCRVHRGRLEMGPAYAERGLDPAFAALVSELNRTVPPEFFELIARSAVMSGGFAETVPQALRAHVREVAATTGVIDSFALFAQDGEGYGVNLTGPSARAVSAPARIRGLWNKVGVHLASAMRLRRRFSSSRAVRRLREGLPRLPVCVQQCGRVDAHLHQGELRHPVRRVSARLPADAGALSRGVGGASGSERATGSMPTRARESSGNITSRGGTASGVSFWRRPSHSSSWRSQCSGGACRAFPSGPSGRASRCRLPLWSARRLRGGRSWRGSRMPTAVSTRNAIASS